MTRQPSAPRMCISHPNEGCGRLFALERWLAGSAGTRGIRRDVIDLRGHHDDAVGAGWSAQRRHAGPQYARRPDQDHPPALEHRPRQCRDEWRVQATLTRPAQALPFDSLAGLRKALYEAHPHFAALDVLQAADPAGLGPLADLGGSADKAGFVSPVTDFYQTNPIARASAVMAECSALASGRLQQAAE